jgi:hypothetical protein
VEVEAVDDEAKDVRGEGHEWQEDESGHGRDV